MSFYKLKKRLIFLGHFQKHPRFKIPTPEPVPHNLDFKSSYPFLPATTPKAPPPFPNILFKSLANHSGLSRAIKCPPDSLCDSKTTGPNVLAHVFGTTDSSCGLNAKKT